MYTDSKKIKFNSPIYCLGDFLGNNLFIKREDLIPYCFGGNKARKAYLFFEEADKYKADCIVTYGSSHSNHCRIVANMCAQRGIDCFIIAPAEVSDNTFNSQLMDLFNARITFVPVSDVSQAIQSLLSKLEQDRRRPFFIPGGGHGNTGTQAFIDCYEEICSYELMNQIHFDYVFFASGTGTTQAGLIVGKIQKCDKREIIGISIARKNPRGRNIVIDSVCEFLPHIDRKVADAHTVFIDEYIDKYGQKSQEVESAIDGAMIKYGIPLDVTYTGKAFLGMKKYIHQYSVNNKTILFIHTGGTPLYFDYLESKK